MTLKRDSKSLLLRLIKYGTIAAFGIAALAYPAAFMLETRAVEVQQIRLHDEALTKFNLYQYSEGDWDEDIASIYGTKEGKPLSVLFIDSSRFIKTVDGDESSVALLPKEKGDNFLQTQTVFFFAQWLALGGAFAGVLGLLLFGFVRARKRKRYISPDTLAVSLV